LSTSNMGNSSSKKPKSPAKLAGSAALPDGSSSKSPDNKATNDLSDTGAGAGAVTPAKSEEISDDNFHTPDQGDSPLSIVTAVPALPTPPPRPALTKAKSTVKQSFRNKEGTMEVNFNADNVSPKTGLALVQESLQNEHDREDEKPQKAHDRDEDKAQKEHDRKMEAEIKDMTETVSKNLSDKLSLYMGTHGMKHGEALDAIESEYERARKISGKELEHQRKEKKMAVEESIARKKSVREAEAQFMANTLTMERASGTLGRQVAQKLLLDKAHAAGSPKPPVRPKKTGQDTSAMAFGVKPKNLSVDFIASGTDDAIVLTRDQVDQFGLPPLPPAGTRHNQYFTVGRVKAPPAGLSAKQVEDLFMDQCACPLKEGWTKDGHNSGASDEYVSAYVFKCKCSTKREIMAKCRLCLPKTEYEKSVRGSAVWWDIQFPNNPKKVQHLNGVRLFLKKQYQIKDASTKKAADATLGKENSAN
ncbi:MAG: hypothetical protein SGILL_006191, partial [Bacillariaceae sp.]